MQGYLYFENGNDPTIYGDLAAILKDKTNTNAIEIGELYKNIPVT